MSQHLLNQNCQILPPTKLVCFEDSYLQPVKTEVFRAHGVLAGALPGVIFSMTRMTATTIPEYEGIRRTSQPPHKGNPNARN